MTSAPLTAPAAPALAPSNLHIAWARLFVRAAAASGVTHAVLSPGSRSTPLALALAAEPGIALEVVVDERSAAFYALGQARVTGRPTLLACTSGTAGAHYLPALIEASQSFVPMLVVTADRPWELYDAAAPQTIDQAKLFGGFVRHYAELGLPDAAPSAIRAVPRIAAQAVARALGPTPGPVHVNARFRKPLDPVDVPGPEPWEPLVASLLARGAPAVHAPSPATDPTAIAAVAARIARAERALLVAGPAPLAQAEPAARDAILELARRTGLPLLAESTSQLLLVEEHRASGVVAAFDSILRTAAFRAGPAPDLIVQLGAPPTSSAYADMVAGLPDTARVIVAPHGWNDPHGDAAMVVLAEPAAFARALCEAVPERAEITRWMAFFASTAREALRIAAHESEASGLTEGAVARAVVASCPEGATLAVGNSSPVRDLDAYCGPSRRAIRVAHQRGASGIDGLVSGAAGVASVAKGPVALLLGDVSLTHDLGALALLARATTPLVVVVVQNGGGRIFDRLPVASRVDAGVFERCFATPQAVRFDRAAAAFGVPYARVETRAALDEALAAAWARPGATLVEAVTPPGEGARIMRRVNERLDRWASEPDLWKSGTGSRSGPGWGKG